MKGEESKQFEVKSGVGERGQNMQVESNKYPCGICGKGVGRNSIKCRECKKWIHKKCSEGDGEAEERPGL